MDSMDKAEQAFKLGLEYEKRFRGCAQGAVAAIQDALDVKDACVYKCASGLSAGGGQCTDGSCGAYVGGVMMMSLLFGRAREDEPTEKGTEDKHASTRLAAELHDRFIAKYGSVRCQDIHEKIFGRRFELRSSDGKDAFEAAGAHTDDDKCGAVVGTASRWTVELIQNESARRERSR